jgi:hypothetical protein
MVDTEDLKSFARKSVRVRLPPRAPVFAEATAGGSPGENSALRSFLYRTRRHRSTKLTRDSQRINPLLARDPFEMRRTSSGSLEKSDF